MKEQGDGSREPVPFGWSGQLRAEDGGSDRAPSTILMGREPGYGYGYEDRSWDVWRYFDVLWRRRWTIGSAMAFCLVTAIVYTFSATPMYRSAAVVQIQPQGPNVLDFDEVQQSSGQAQAYSDFFQTQYSILESRALAKRVIEELAMDQEEDFNPFLGKPGTLRRLRTAVTSMLGGENEEVSQEEIDQTLVEGFLDEMDVRPQRKSFLVEVGFSSPSPNLAAAVAATISQQYIELTLDQRMDAASQGRTFIEKQLSLTKSRLEASERELQELAAGRDLYALEQEEQVLKDRLNDLNNRLTAAEGARIQLESVYEQARKGDTASLSMVVNSPLINALKEELSRHEVEYAKALQTFTPAYPAVKVLGSRVQTLKQQIQAEEGRIVASLRSDYNSALSEESMLKVQLGDQRDTVVAYEQRAIDFKIMRQEVNTIRAIYEDLLRRSKEVQVTEAIRASNVTVVDAPVVPLEPDRPKLPMNLALGLLIGVFGGVGAAVVQDYLDDTVKTAEDVEDVVRLPTLASIPQFTLGPAGQTGDGPSADVEVAANPTSAGAEAVRTLRASLFLAAPGGFPSRLIMTSARPGDGKTCIAANLGIALAQMGRRVVLVDCDLRKPRLHNALGLPREPGLSSYLAGDIDLEGVLQEATQVKNLAVITAGPLPPNPADLIDSDRSEALVAALEEHFDHIIFDAPPALVYADVPILTARIGGACLLVARSGETPKRALRQAGDYLVRMQSKLLGVVLNCVSTSRGYSYYGTGNYGGYGGYGEQHDAPATPSPTPPGRLEA